MIYNRIKLYSPAKYDYLICTSTTPSPAEITQHETANFTPQWDLIKSMEILAPFTNNLISTYIESLTTPVQSWKIYRQKKNSKTVEFVCEVPKDSLSIIDYKVASTVGVCYYVMPQTQDKIGASLESKFVEPHWSGISITPLFEIKENVYIPKRVWTFELNVTENDIEVIDDRTTFNNHTRYPKFIIGDRNYTSATVSCLLGHVECSTGQYTDSLQMLEEWQSDVRSTNPCLYKNSKGEMKLVVIKPLPYGHADYVQKPTHISFQWTELSSLDGVTAFEENTYL